MSYPTGAMCVTQSVKLTVRSSAWEYLSSTLDPDRDVLVFVWGSSGFAASDGWSATVFPRDELPMVANRRLIETKLGKLSIAVPQRQHLEKLHGRTLSMQSRLLTVS